MDENIEPRDIKIVFEGGSTGDETPLPEKLTIVGNLNRLLENIDAKLLVANASVNGKSTKGYINDFKFWFPQLNNFRPKVVIFYSGHNDADVLSDYNLKNNNFEIDIENKTFREGKLENIIDYIVNNSFFISKTKQIKNVYLDMDKEKVVYDLNKKELYKNFKYVDYDEAKYLYDQREMNIRQEKTLLFYRKNLEELKYFLDKYVIIPIFVTQIKYDGLSSKRLYLINEETKKFANVNSYKIVKLDEIYKPEVGDFFDDLHTTPKGSEKIANIIFNEIKEKLYNVVNNN